MERLLARCERQKMVGVEAERGSPVLPDYPGIGQNHTAAELEQKLADQKKIADGVQTYYDRFLGWSMEFGMASLARKRSASHRPSASSTCTRAVMSNT